MERLAERLAHLWVVFSPMNKLKIFVGFYMITANVASVYDVAQPNDVKEIYRSIALFCTLGQSKLRARRHSCLVPKDNR